MYRSALNRRKAIAHIECAVGLAHPRSRGDLAIAALKSTILDSLYAVHAI